MNTRNNISLWAVGTLTPTPDQPHRPTRKQYTQNSVPEHHYNANCFFSAVIRSLWSVYPRLIFKRIFFILFTRLPRVSCHSPATPSYVIPDIYFVWLVCVCRWIILSNRFVLSSSFFLVFSGVSREFYPFLCNRHALTWIIHQIICISLGSHTLICYLDGGEV